MILAIDIGNTNIVLGCISGNDKIVYKARITTDYSKTEYQYAMDLKNLLQMANIEPKRITGSIISSVVPPLVLILEKAIKFITGIVPLVVGEKIRTKLNIKLDNPSQLGSDQIVDAVAAIYEYKTPVIIFDMGTATTVSVIDEDKNYLGGMIIPGIKISQDALTSKTSKLPKISIEPPKNIIGKNTVECMKSGVIYANAAMIDGIISRIEEELGINATVIATGGFSGGIIPFCKRSIIIDDDLLIKGLGILYMNNK